MSHVELGVNSGSAENGAQGKTVRKTIIHAAPPAAVFFNSNSGTKNDQGALNIQLRQKFAFFLQDLVRVCSVANITFPLNLLDERGPLTPIQPFLKRNGLKYIFQFIQTHASNLQISRAGFSLLIVCITFLRKLHQDFKQQQNHPASWFFDKNGQVQSHQAPLTPLQVPLQQSHAQQEEKAWFIQTYARLTDIISVGNCMSIFITTHDAVVQELILNLVANLILVSEESAAHLLQAPSIFNKNRHSLDSSSSYSGGVGGGMRRSLNNRGSTADTTDSRRTTNNNNMSFRDSTRPNSRNSTANNYDDSSVNNSCLAYMLSVVILQRNRHQLLGAAAEIIILLSRDGSNPLCQHIARLSSCPLPLLSALESSSSAGTQPRNNNNNRTATSIDISNTNNDSGSGDSSNNLACNPLTTKIIDWAGVKVFLKFLQRYHQLLPSSSRGTDASNDEYNFQLKLRQSEDGNEEDQLQGQQEEYDPSQINPAAMMSEELRQEYHTVHHRALLAICLLIRGAQEIASYLVQLPGAVDVLRASANVFNEMHIEDHDGAVIIAMNALQLEKQKLRRMKMLANANNAIAKNKNRKNKNELKRLAKIAAAQSAPTPNNTTTGRRSTTRGSASSTTSIHGKRLKPLFGSGSSNNMNMSPAKLEKHEDHVTLAAPTHVVNFHAEYPVMTEKHSLYLQTHAMQKEASDPMKNDVSPLQKAAVARLVAGAAGPLQSESSHDTLLSTSLKIIDAETNDHILIDTNSSSDGNMPFDGIATNNTSNGNTMRNNTAMSSFGQLPWSAMDQSSSLSFLPRPLDGNETPHKLGLIEPWDHGLSAYRDFFQVLPHRPAMPARIEPQDVIHGSEDMDKIRQKFQAIATAAVKKIHNKGVMINGKGTVSIDERARRVYSPPPEKRMSASFSIPPSRTLSRSPTAASGSSSLTSNNVNKRPKSGGGLQPLDLSEANQLESLSSGRGGRYPALSHRDGSDANMINDPEKTPAWNPRPEGLAYYGIRLDNVEFEEQDLFDRFKPIFDYDAPEPERSPKKEKNLENGTGGFQTTRGKITGEMEQTNDLLLI